MIFIDTSAFYALVNREDPNYKKAASLLEALLDSHEELVTHNYLFVESCALIHRRMGLAIVRQFYRDIYRLCRLFFVSQSQHERAAKTYIHQEGSRYSLVDCVSFEIMKTHGIKRCFAFDDDFKKRGFEVI
ncbi:MAG: PIN domain-containing protein [Deltaproteobacteria bacterium]|nr:PIN domain-containing protein [Deltaproteobacteria bacterium]